MLKVFTALSVQEAADGQGDTVSPAWIESANCQDEGFTGRLSHGVTSMDRKCQLSTN
jgi:hypothetical protein